MVLVLGISVMHQARWTYLACEEGSVCIPVADAVILHGPGAHALRLFVALVSQ